jgi:predicted nucleic-acid-binding Zn-ribbon protein
MSGDEYLHGAKRVHRLLAAKKTSFVCPMCRNEEWGVFTSPSGATTKDLLANEHPAYILTCLNCGFVRWHVASVLDDEEDQTPAPGSEA